MHSLSHPLKSASAGVGAMALSAQCAAGKAKLRQGIAAQAELPTQLQQRFSAFQNAVAAHDGVCSLEGNAV